MGREWCSYIEERAFAARHDEPVRVQMEFHFDVFNGDVLIALIFLVADNGCP
jgi:hypothetical protein